MIYTTGNETVDAIAQIHLEGNVIPHKWFEHIRFENGKPDLTAIVILSEIIYWYRPIYVKDEISGNFIGVKKRFKADLLQRSYDSFSEQFGITKRQAREAICRLEELGFIKRHFRTIEANNTKLSNVLFIELVHSNVIAMTLQSYPYDVSTSEVSHPNVTPMALERQTNTEITTETTTKITTENKKESRKPVYDESSVHYQLANLLYEKILIDDPSFKKPNLQNWADHIRLMMERDERTEEQIKYLIEWSQNNSFWKSNILSTKKLREKATTLIRQIKAERAKEKKSQNYNRGRTEVIPDWFHNRSSNSNTEPSVELPEELIDFEAERQRILEKLGKVEI